MTDAEWLNSLKIGDTVVVYSSCSCIGSSFSLKKIKRITKTLFVLDNNSRFNRKNGRLSESFCGAIKSCIAESTPELLSKIKRERLIGRLDNIKWSDLPNEMLESIIDELTRYGWKV